MSEQVQVVYAEIPITYNERDDKWTFTLRGRDRSAESLAKAKEAIDKPVKESAKPFQRTQAYLTRYRGELQIVEVTSVAETPQYSSGKEFWITKDGKRSKEDVFYLYAFSEDNQKRVAQMTELQKEIEGLEKKYEEIKRKLEKFQPVIPE